MGQANKTQAKITADYNVSKHDYFLEVDATAGNITLTLPPADSWGSNSAGQFVFYRSDTSANSVTLAVSGGDSVNISAINPGIISFINSDAVSKYVVTTGTNYGGSGLLSSTTLLNGWGGTIYYEKMSDGLVKVFLDAATIGTTTNGTNIYTLPAGMRPSVKQVVQLLGNDAATYNAAGRIDVATDGTCKVYGYSGANTVVRFTAIFIASN